MATAMGAAFLGHGSPMNALAHNRYTETWRALGASVPRPRAILMISAHWYVGATALTAMPRPRTIHDFYGFPRELFEIDYPAPGLPELVEEVADTVRPDRVGADLDSWGLDHGTWSVLLHAFPNADVPVVQLSINALKPPDYHLMLGARLSTLRHQGVLVMGSGNVVHNLSAMDRRLPDSEFPWARAFNEAAIEIMTTRPSEAARLMDRSDFLQIAPTPEHFLPLLYIAGVAAATNTSPTVLVDGYADGSLSMTSFGVGVQCPPPALDLPGTAPVGELAPDQSNI